MGKSLYTREATTDEVAFRFHVYASTRSEEVAEWGLDPVQQETFLHMQFRMQQQSYVLQYPGVNYRIIVLDENAIGHMLLVDRADDMKLVDLALLPDFRNAGIGSSILRMLQTKSKNKPIRLHVISTNRARNLYERLGFQIVGTHGLHIEMEWKQRS